MNINGTPEKEHETFSTCQDKVTGIGLDLPSLTCINLEGNTVYKHFKDKGACGLSRKGKDMSRKQ